MGLDCDFCGIVCAQVQRVSCEATCGRIFLTPGVRTDVLVASNGAEIEATCGRSLRIFKKSQYEKLRISKDCARFVIGIFAGELQ